MLNSNAHFGILNACNCVRRTCRSTKREHKTRPSPIIQFSPNNETACGNVRSIVQSVYDATTPKTSKAQQCRELQHSTEL